ncbi:MAG: membrane dipeptidase, partial [Rhizobiaceae bacterium]|nr:membrane dipeptidase [Rhizobiaceae bacterium]
KQALRLIETFHTFAERHADKMAVALTPADARRIVAAGRMAVFLGCEAGWDVEGDPDVLAAFYRLGLRVVQFATQTGFNAFSDSAGAPLNGQPPDHFHGINARGHALVEKMNQLGILIDITHATEEAQRQIIAASHAPVVASHETVRAVSGAGLSDDLLKDLAGKGGLIGIHGAAAVVGKRYRTWMGEHPDLAAKSGASAIAMLSHHASAPRSPGDHGEFITQFDAEAARLWDALGDWKEYPEAVPFIPTADEWAEHVAYVIKLVGPDHVAIGLDMTAGRSGVPANAGGYPDLLAALKKITTPENVRKITGENWLRVLGDAKKA